MKQMNQTIKNKGGRPKKHLKKDCRVSVRCSYIQRKAIQAKAKKVKFSVSEYLLKMGLTGNIDRREKVLPKEVLRLIGTFNHTAANLNQIAKKRNGIEPFIFEYIGNPATDRIKCLHDNVFKVALMAGMLK